MLLQELDYVLPQELIAQRAIEPRDHARLLVVDRAGAGFADRRFYDLPEYLNPGDVLVLNDTKVIPARMHFVKATGGKVEGLFLQELGIGRWEMMFRGIAKLKAGTPLSVEGSEAEFVLGSRLSDKSFEVAVQPAVPAVDLLERIGQVPLPPYIQKGRARPEDRGRYQTVFGVAPGAVAAPTAGLHFTGELIARIRAMGVKIATVTLHVGVGTFTPVTAEDLRDHQMHKEWYRIDSLAAETINAAKQDGRKVVAVGTTSVRVLETAAGDGGVTAGEGWTGIFIYPPCQFKVVDRLVTNFHLPRTTLLAMVFALAGKERTLDAYRHAVENKYRFYSYGDAMLIL